MFEGVLVVKQRVSALQSPVNTVVIPCVTYPRPNLICPNDVNKSDEIVFRRLKPFKLQAVNSDEEQTRPLGNT